MDTYFSKFPTIEYDGVLTRNITERVVMITTPRLVPTNYYPWELSNHMRPDQIAGEYYMDPNLDWMIYIVNNIVDPYYGWHLYEEDFDAFIIKKYGSIEYSQQLIAFYRNNWYDDSVELTPGQYESLPVEHKIYYEPVIGAKQRVKGWRRREEDWTRATNRIELWHVTQGANAVANGDLLVLTYETFPEGWAQCVLANSTALLVKHIIGNTFPGSVATAWSDHNRTATLNSIHSLQVSIPDTEAKFWEPVAFYDVEREKNENKRFIQLLDSGYVMETAENIRKALIKKQ